MDRIKLADLASQAEDLYFQNYAPDDAFFDADDFKLLVCNTYTKLINDEYQNEKSRNKANEGFSYVSLTPSWLVSELVDVKTDEAFNVKYAETKLPVFSFGFDDLCSAIQSIEKTGNCKCGDLIRIANKDKWMVARAPFTNNIYFTMSGERIEFPKLSCNPGQLLVTYLPAMLSNNDECSLPEIYAISTITTVLQLMFGAKKEVIVDKSNNANPNENDTSELDPNNVNK